MLRKSSYTSTINQLIATLLCFASLYVFIIHGYLRPRTTARILEQQFAVDEKATPGRWVEFQDEILNLNNTNESQKRPRVLLVSALYPLSKSKHSQSDYSHWLSLFLSRITTEIYFYAPPSLNRTIRESRPPNFPMTFNSTYPSIFSVPALEGLEGTYTAMHKKDREQVSHSPELYAVWNAKPFFLNEAVKQMREMEGKEYDFAFWVDAGSFREEHAYTEWPDPGRLTAVWGEGTERNGEEFGMDGVIFVPIYGSPGGKVKNWKEDMGPVDNEVSEGSFFGGSPSAISWYTSTYYTYHSYYLSLGLFVGKDQTLINSLLLLFPSRFITVWQRDPMASARNGLLPFTDGHLGTCGAEWYYYEFFLSNMNTRQKMREIWAKSVGWPWKDWEWWMARRECRLTTVLGMKEALERAFGKGWKSPEARAIGVETKYVNGVDNL